MSEHIFENDRFFYFILYWDDDPDVLSNIRHILDMFPLILPNSG